MVCVDNSEFTRNGDYAPTRFQAQADAVNLLAGAKTQHHPENTVGVMTMALKRLLGTHSLATSLATCGPAPALPACLPAACCGGGGSMP